MSPLVNARPGDVNYALNEPVAINQTIRKGDLVKYDASKNIVKAAVGDTALLGFAVAAVTTGATVSEKDRCIVDPFHSQSLTRATIKNGTTFDRATLVGTAAGFIDEGGEIRVDTAAAVKQAVIVEIVERGGVTTVNDPKEVYIQVIPANRVRQ